MTSFVRALLSSLLLLLAGCDRKDRSVMEREPAFSRQYRQGKLTVTVTASETNITAKGKIQLTLTSEMPRGHDVVVQDTEGLMASFFILDSLLEPEQILANGLVLQRQIWELAPCLLDDLIIPPLRIVAGKTSLQTDPVAIHVESILPPDIENPEIRDIAAPAVLLEEQRQRQRLWLIVPGAIAVSLLVGAGIWQTRRSRMLAVLPPHEAAFHALENLEKENPAPVQFIHELNRILRIYLKGRFNLPALESTSRELLPLIDDPQLVSFLTDCDHVKFAHAVTPEFTGKALAYVRSYIETSQPEEDPCS